jgi:putative transposase
MATHRKVFRFRMRPTRAQEPLLNRLAGARRWVFNWGLQRKREHYADTGKTLTAAALSAELAALKSKPETAWLKDVDSQSLQQALKDLDRAFRNFFEKRARYPRFKSRKRSLPGFRIPQRVKVEGRKVFVPKVGWVRIRLSQPVELAKNPLALASWCANQGRLHKVGKGCARTP